MKLSSTHKKTHDLRMTPTSSCNNPSMNNLQRSVMCSVIAWTNANLRKREGKRMLIKGSYFFVSVCVKYLYGYEIIYMYKEANLIPCTYI